MASRFTIKLTTRSRHQIPGSLADTFYGLTCLCLRLHPKDIMLSEGLRACNDTMSLSLSGGATIPDYEYTRWYKIWRRKMGNKVNLLLYMANGDSALASVLCSPNFPITTYSDGGNAKGFSALKTASSCGSDVGFGPSNAASTTCRCTKQAMSFSASKLRLC